MARGKLLSKAGILINHSQTTSKVHRKYPNSEELFDFAMAQGFNTLNQCIVCSKYHKDYKYMEKCILKLYFEQKNKGEN